MKKIAILLLGLAVLPVFARPKFVGHRGSGYGVENTALSFQTGVDLGYDFLETDVKFAKADVLVCTHDDSTKRLGGTKAIASSTLEELQGETLRQRRAGTDWTGHICSMREYLDICREGGVRPLIELKWTEGINSKDTSKIPLLIAEIDSAGMRDKCIILTSMKPCLEYIRTNYPDIELQFLTAQYWANHFDWCVKWKIDADIMAGCFDKETVDRFHANGLKVNMWTTNKPLDYRKYVEWGCDFITTDRLDPASLPDF